jgi:hypothetical protein
VGDTYDLLSGQFLPRSIELMATPVFELGSGTRSVLVVFPAFKDAEGPESSTTPSPSQVDQTVNQARTTSGGPACSSPSPTK